MPELVERVGRFVAVALSPEQNERLLVVVDGLPVMAGVVGNVAQTVQRSRLTNRVVVISVQTESGLAMSLRGGVLAQSGRIPTQVVERIGGSSNLIGV